MSLSSFSSPSHAWSCSVREYGVDGTCLLRSRLTPAPSTTIPLATIQKNDLSALEIVAMASALLSESLLILPNRLSVIEHAKSVLDALNNYVEVNAIAF